MILSPITAPLKLGKLTHEGAGFSPLSVEYARVSTRQTALEIASAGVDQTRSWSCWARFSNLVPNSQTIFSVTNDTNIIR
jgi:hypothetical protein